ncbi:MAG: amidase [Polyangiaceae bacterium]|nr:amidase [Polyangiaceae bacterium]
MHGRRARYFGCGGCCRSHCDPKISVAEATDAAIARIEKANRDLNAVAVKTYHDARRYHTLPRGSVLYGVPTLIKDNDNVKGHPTQHGTGAFKSKTAKNHSPFVRQFLSTGVNSLGKSTMPEFGLLCSTENERWGITRNPWNTAYTTGGSSSGSAAMVACGAVPIATADDGAGSIRIPAAVCGLVGLKPSRGRLVAMEGTHLMPINIVHQGVLTRSVRDTAAFYAAAEAFWRNPRLPEMGYVRHSSKERLRIAVFENQPPGRPGHIDDDTYRVQMETARLLESLGHRVACIRVPLDVEELTAHFLNYYGMLAYFASHWGEWIHGAKVDKEQLERFTMGLALRFRRNVLEMPQSLRVLLKAAAEIERLFEGRYDLLMSPVGARKTPQIGFFSPDLEYDEICQRASDYAPYTGLQNVTGSPSISLPLGADSDGMPIGVQFTAKMGEDRRLLELAYELEAAKPWRMIHQR